MDSFRSLERELRRIERKLEHHRPKRVRPRALPSLCFRLTDAAHAALVRAAAEHWSAPVSVKEAGGMLLAWGVDHYKPPKKPKAPKPRASNAGVRVCVRLSQRVADKLWSMAGAPRIPMPGKGKPRKPTWGAPIAPDTAAAIVVTWALAHHPRHDA